ncbi:hypothetical protein E8E11_010984 [Didymella keratinophila]|nr:hypothetical protein E8E11_010984 [Didymella keratinophila]
MPHNSQKKRAADERGLQRNSAPEEQSPASGQTSEYTAHDGQRDEPQVPLYDDFNHVAYGWQQMSVLPDIHSLTWPVESPSDEDKDGPSGFNPHPGRGQGPRSRSFKPFVDPSEAQQEDANAGADNMNDRSTSLALAPKDVNQKLGDGRSQALPLSKVTGGRREKSRPQSKRMIVVEVEKPREADRRAERMLRLHEEPAPLRIPRAEPLSTLEQARMLRAEQKRAPAIDTDGGVALQQDGSGNEDIKSLMAAITEQLSAFTGQCEPQFEHRSAVPKPLNLEGIKAAKKKRRRARLESEASGDTVEGVKGGEKLGSVESFATGASSDIEKFSIPDTSEHNGARRKWYKGFRRSEK